MHVAIRRKNKQTIKAAVSAIGERSRGILNNTSDCPLLGAARAFLLQRTRRDSLLSHTAPFADDLLLCPHLWNLIASLADAN